MRCKGTCYCDNCGKLITMCGCCDSICTCPLTPEEIEAIKAEEKKITKEELENFFGEGSWEKRDQQ